MADQGELDAHYTRMDKIFNILCVVHLVLSMGVHEFF